MDLNFKKFCEIVESAGFLVYGYGYIKDGIIITLTGDSYSYNSKFYRYTDLTPLRKYDRSYKLKQLLKYKLI